MQQSRGKVAANTRQISSSSKVVAKTWLSCGKGAATDRKQTFAGCLPQYSRVIATTLMHYRNYDEVVNS
jgi:hypothetical protein